MERKRFRVGILAASALAALAAGAEVKKVVMTNDLTTSWGRALTPENVWREYPRPQLVRGGWASLNGTWEYAIASAAADEPAKYDGTILVPFGVETPLSGVRRKVLPEDQIWYRRTFNVHPKKGFRTILNFERVDFRAHVFVNGQEATDVPHEGGNVPFCVDVTPYVKDGANELTLAPNYDYIIVNDDLETAAGELLDIIAASRAAVNNKENTQC